MILAVLGSFNAGLPASPQQLVATPNPCSIVEESYGNDIRWVYTQIMDYICTTVRMYAYR